MSSTTLYVITKDGTLEEYAEYRNSWEFERRTCWATYDRACLRTSDIPLYAEAMERFANFYESAMEGKVFSIPEQAADMRKIFAEAEANGWRGVCWNQTSVAECWEDEEATEDEMRSMLMERLRELGAIGDNDETACLTDSVGSILDVALAFIDDMRGVEFRVPYNVDRHQRHWWLPGADASVLPPSSECRKE